MQKPHLIFKKLQCLRQPGPVITQISYLQKGETRCRIAHVLSDFDWEFELCFLFC